MQKRLLGVSTLLTALFLTTSSNAQAATDTTAPRIATMVTTWDDYYLYAGFEVTDTNVIGMNKSPSSRPQEDDDVEIFLDTSGKPGTERTAKTYQMVVSAAGGAYFSVGDGTKIPVPKVVYTYKYASQIEGTLNNSSDKDVGYTIELAIPWQELGLTGPPSEGTTWGLNVISRDRSSTVGSATRFYSLSPNVTSAADVQDPSKWSRIVFGGSKTTSSDLVVAPHVTGRFPLINGSIISGEWPSVSRLAFGTSAIEAPSPTVAEEPNGGDSPFGEPPPVQQPPQVTNPTPPVPTVQTPVAAAPNSIALPGGGSIKIVPGGIPDPVTPTQTPSTQRPGGFVNPLTVKYPKNYVPTNTDNGVSLTGSLALGQYTPPALITALYRIDFNGDPRKGAPQNIWNSHGASTLIDQPINGAGPWFSGLRPLWHRQQLSDLRRAGINIALVQVSSADPSLSRELDALTSALKTMKQQGLDYPMIGLALGASDRPDLNFVAAHIPAEFRATYLRTPQDKPGFLVYRQRIAADTATVPPLADGMPVVMIQPDDKVAYVSPGGKTSTGFSGRSQGSVYRDSWSNAQSLQPDFVIIDSWNDYERGTEIAASRQYGEAYADQTRLQAIAFNGTKQWHAKYLAEHTPRVIRPKALYQVMLRVENAGTLPWRAGEGYSLCTRWYRNGRLYDDSAPRIPLTVDVLPGETVTLGIGLAAQNSFGDDLEPGDYTLVFDMVQGQDKWFSYASDVPLQVPITIVTADATTAKPQALFLGGDTPSSGLGGSTYKTTMSVRNDSTSDWEKDQVTLAYKIQSIDPLTGVRTLISESKGVQLGAGAIPPGEVTMQAASVNLVDSDGKALAPGGYCVHWFVKPTQGEGAIAGAYDEGIQVVSREPNAKFILSDIPRNVDADRDATAQIAIENTGPNAWVKKDVQIGYHWYALDGREQLWDTHQLSNLSKDVPAGGIDGAISAKFHTPDQPGRYALVWDVRLPDGSWTSTADGIADNDLLQSVIVVGGRGSVSTVDLSKSIPASDTVANFDGAGHGLPDEMLPPDRTAELDLNPLLQAKPGQPLYPSGYYADATGGSVNFLYPIQKSGQGSLLIAKGQTINLPGGNYKAVHLLAAATGGKPIAATFGLDLGGRTVSKQIASIIDWTVEPKGAIVTVGWHSPYRTTSDGAELVPCYLGDYRIDVDPSQRLSSLTLPNDPNIKIVAISLEK